MSGLSFFLAVRLSLTSSSPQKVAFFNTSSSSSSSCDDQKLLQQVFVSFLSVWHPLTYTVWAVTMTSSLCKLSFCGWRFFIFLINDFGFFSHILTSFLLLLLPLDLLLPLQQNCHTFLAIGIIWATFQTELCHEFLVTFCIIHPCIVVLPYRPYSLKSYK